jgi:hypothetical protein
MSHSKMCIEARAKFIEAQLAAHDMLLAAASAMNIDDASDGPTTTELSRVLRDAREARHVWMNLWVLCPEAHP